MYVFFSLTMAKKAKLIVYILGFTFEPFLSLDLHSMTYFIAKLTTPPFLTRESDISYGEISYRAPSRMSQLDVEPIHLGTSPIFSTHYET